MSASYPQGNVGMGRSGRRVIGIYCSSICRVREVLSSRPEPCESRVSRCFRRHIMGVSNVRPGVPPQYAQRFPQAHAQAERTSYEEPKLVRALGNRLPYE
jgi:hypothetical protein